MSARTFDELAAVIRACVTDRGHDWNLIAAAHLAADSRVILWKLDQFVDEDGWIDWEQLAEHVDRSGWSSGEKALIRLACSLAGHSPASAGVGWGLADMLAPLDHGNSLLAAEAVRYASLGPAAGGAR